MAKICTFCQKFIVDCQAIIACYSYYASMTNDRKTILYRERGACDLEEFGMWHRNIRMTLMQLEPGRFSAYTGCIDLHDVFIVKRSSKLRHFSIGEHPGYLCFLFPLASEETLFCKKSIYSSGNQIISNNKEMVCSINPGNFEEIVIGIKIDELYKYLSEVEIDNFLNSASSDKLMVVQEGRRQMATHFAIQMYEEVCRIHRDCVSPKESVAQRSKLIILFLYQYAGNFRKTTKTEKKSSSHERILDRGLRYIFGEGGALITLGELSTGIFSSKRSIQYAFSELIGMTPIEFSKALRLNVVRSGLLRFSREETTIGHALRDYQVKNTSRFRHEYFNLFREYPRDTLVQCLP